MAKNMTGLLLLSLEEAVDASEKASTSMAVLYEKGYVLCRKVDLTESEIEKRLVSLERKVSDLTEMVSGHLEG